MANRFKNMDDIKSQLDGKFSGVITVPMWEIRDAYGAGRLGVKIVESIMEELDGRGIGHLPKKLPGDQWAFARIYLKNSSVGRVTKAVMKVDPDNDAALRRLTNEKADETLRKVRELVCD